VIGKEILQMYLTNKDLKTFRTLYTIFSEALIGDQSEEGKQAARKDISKNTRIGDKASIQYSRLRYNLAFDDDFEDMATHLLAYCDKSLPALTKVFGRQALVDVLPPEAKNNRIATIAEELEANRISSLIREALKHDPS
jgi:hypothetical protein